jgi:hypothetical protein
VGNVEGKQIVYRYNGNPKSEETEVDQHGQMEMPAKGSIIRRKGSSWKVVEVLTEPSVTHPNELRIHRIFLTDNF